MWVQLTTSRDPDLDFLHAEQLRSDPAAVIEPVNVRQYNVVTNGISTECLDVLLTIIFKD